MANAPMEVKCPAHIENHPAPHAVVHMWLMTEAEAASFVGAVRGAAARMVVISSADVYRAYGRLQRLESGPPDPAPLRLDPMLRGYAEVLAYQESRARLIRAQTEPPPLK